MSVINSIFSDEKKFNATLISEGSGNSFGVEGAVNLIEEVGMNKLLSQRQKVVLTLAIRN